MPKSTYLTAIILLLLAIIATTQATSAEDQSGAVTTSLVPKARPLAPFTSPVPRPRPEHIQDHLTRLSTVVKVLASD